MPASFQEILNSRLFKFIVGEKVDGSPTGFLVHEEAIAQLSEPLYNLMKGSMAESKEGCARWDSVSKETFERFAQFAYTGDYSVPKVNKWHKSAKEEEIEMSSASSINSVVIQNSVSVETAYDESISDGPRVVEVDPEPVPDTPPAVEVYPEPVSEPPPAVDEFIWSSSRKDEKKKKWLGWGKEPIPEAPQLVPPTPLKAFHSLSFPLQAPRNSYESTCEPTSQFQADESYSNIFHSHVSLYILGDYQLIDSLKALALYKLHKTLCIFQLNDENVENAVDLVRIVYAPEGGEGRSDDEGIGSLRSLVCQYMAANALMLSRNEEFLELLAEGGQFVRDFLGLCLRRIG